MFNNHFFKFFFDKGMGLFWHVINQILQVGVIRTAATTQNLYSESIVQEKHLFPPVRKVVLMKDFGSFELNMVQ